MMTDEDVKKAEILKAELQKVIDYFKECEEASEEISDLEKEVLSLKQELDTIKAENKFLRDGLARISGVVYEYYCSEGRFVSSKMDRVDVQRIAQVIEECGL